MVSLVFAIVRWYVQVFSTFFSKKKYSIQKCLGQFLFEVNRVSIRREIPKKLCASHYASEADSAQLSEKSCFRFRQKISTGQLSCLAFQLSIE